MKAPDFATTKDQGHLSKMCNGSGVVIGNDQSSNGSRFLIIENRHESYVHVGVPLSHVALHGGKVVRLKNRNPGACCHIAPATMIFTPSQHSPVLAATSTPTSCKAAASVLRNAPASHKFY